ncbi:MAG: L-threonylcarbamoyladenylate synthase [Porticoccaceae bacterium]
MADYFSIHPENPQRRSIAQVAERMRRGAVVVYPTDSVYAIGCHIGEKQALDRIRQLRQLDKNHNFTLMCRDLSEISTYAKIDNSHFRMLKAATPGPFTFILTATSEVPRRLQHPKRKTIGLRVPSDPIAQALLAELGEPMMSVTLIMPGDEYPLSDPWEIRETLEHHVDIIVDGGHCGLEPTTVVDLSSGSAELVRQGNGDFSAFI